MSKETVFSPNIDKTTLFERVNVQQIEQRWITALFVTFRYSSNDSNGRDDGLLRQYHDILQQAVGPFRGDVVALSNQEALAVFSACGAPSQHIENAVDSASFMLDQVRLSNMQRLAQDLTPLRLGIGLDAGRLMLASCNRHPCLDPGLQDHVDKARRLSNLNCQTPFPTVFVSHAVASSIDYTQRYAIQNLGTVFVEKHADPMTVYALMDRVDHKK